MLFLTMLGKKNSKKRMRTSCSKILEIVFGATFSLPRKYPFRMEEIDIKGSVKERAMIRGVTSGCFNKVFAMKGAQKKMRIIKRKLKRRINNAVVKNIFFPLIFPSLTSLEMLIGRANVARVRKRE